MLEYRACQEGLWAASQGHSVFGQTGGVFLLWFCGVESIARENLSGLKCTFTESYSVSLSNELDTSLWNLKINKAPGEKKKSLQVLKCTVFWMRIPNKIGQRLTIWSCRSTNRKWPKLYLGLGTGIFWCWWLQYAKFLSVRFTASMWVLFQLSWNNCGSKGVLAATKVSPPVFWVSYLALRQSPAAGYKTQSVVLAVGFGLHTGLNLSWIGADWCGKVLNKGAVSAGGCAWLDNGISAPGLVNWSYIWLCKLTSTYFSWSCGLPRKLEDCLVNWYWLGMPVWWLITKISLPRTTKTFHAGDAFTGHQIAEEVPEDNWWIVS